MLASRGARERRFHHGLTCPRCRSHAVRRWGKERTGVQRYRCGDCRRTFNDLTGTAMARTRKPRDWAAYAETMRQRLSCRNAARILGVNHKTVWAWRHRVMAQLAPEGPPLSGIVEADEMFFRRNYKRSKPRGRRRRKRGSDGSVRGLGRDKVPVLIARARTGETRAVVFPGTATVPALTAALRATLDPRASTLCTDGSGALKAAAMGVGVQKHVALVTRRGQRKRGIYHIQTVNSYQGRLREWLAPFRGVATKYLDRYLHWHAIHERVQRLSPRDGRQVLLGNTAEITGERCCPHCGVALAG